MARRGEAGQSLGSPPVPDGEVGPGLTPKRLRRAAFVVMTLLAATWGIIGLRLHFLPPSGLSDSLAETLALIAGANAIAYELAAYWVGLQKRWGHIVAIALVALNLLLGVTAGMTWLEWTVLGVNVVALGLLFACVPRRR